MENKEINQEWADNLKTQPINIQVLEILKVLDSNADTFSLKPTLIQFQDLLKDIQIANRNLGNKSNKGDFFQERVDDWEE